MIKTRRESDCVGCAECIGCGRSGWYTVKYVVCDECGKEADMEESYQVGGNQYCAPCTIKKVIASMGPDELIDMNNNSYIADYLVENELCEKIDYNPYQE